MRVFLVAGEASGDKLGAAVMAGLRSLRPDVTFDGIGGEAMAQEGLRSRFPMSDLSVMGLVEVLGRYRLLRQRLDEAIRAVLDARPDILLTIDSPDFGLRVAKAVKQAGAGVRCVHYVAPTIWAWRAGRARKLRGVADQLLALFPFEPPLWEAQGVPCDFVGHPVVAEPVATETEARAFRGTFGLGDAPVILALPGSRPSEVERLAPRFGEALGRVVAERPTVRIVLPAAAPVADLVRQAVASWPVKPVILTPRADPLAQTMKRAAFKAADAALAASGTVSLELAAAGTPMVIAYDMAWLTWQVMSRMVRLDSVTLVNIVSGTRVVPEFLGPACRPAPIAKALLRVMENPGAQQEAMRNTMERLGEGGEPPGLRAARAILSRWEAAQPVRAIQPPPRTRVPSGA
jgi:lipid-A-disaccharide synthase